MQKKYIILWMSSMLWITGASAQILIQYNNVKYQEGSTIIWDRYEDVLFNIVDKMSGNPEGFSTKYTFKSYTNVFGTGVESEYTGDNTGQFRLKNPSTAWSVVLNYTVQMMQNSTVINIYEASFTFVTPTYNALQQDFQIAKKITGGCIAPYVVVDNNQCYISEGIGPIIDGIPLDKNMVYAYNWQYSDNSGTTWNNLGVTTADMDADIVDGRWFRRQANVMGTWYNSNVCEVRINKYGNNNFILERSYINSEEIRP